MAAPDSPYPTDEQGWPDKNDYPGVTDFDKTLLGARLEVRKQRAQAEIDQMTADDDVLRSLQKARAEKNIGLLNTYYESVLEVAKKAIDRSQASAELVQKAATAVGAIYTGILALLFSATENQLTWEGVIPGLFLGLAIVLSTAYLAYIEDASKGSDSGGGGGESHRSDDQASLGRDVTEHFLGWINRSISLRARFLRASVWALGFALVFLPAAFVDIHPRVVEQDQAPWPTLAQEAPDALELQEVVYTAQVAEAAAYRDAEPKVENWNWVWGVAALVALAVVGLVAWDKLPGAWAKRKKD